MEVNSRVIRIVALLSIKGIGPTFVKKAISQSNLEQPDVFLSLREILDLGKKQVSMNELEQALARAQEIVFACEADGINIVDCTSNSYSPLLREAKDAPPLLYCRGKLDLLQKKTVGVIGSRKPNENAIRISERIGSFYSDSKWVICNGLAEGVDQACIQSHGKIHSNVVGVLAGGLNYGTTKTILRSTAINAQKILENDGLLVSEMPPGKREDAFSVIKSCRIQAGLSKGLILVQSSMHGGSRYTLKSICETQRPVGIVKPIEVDYNLPEYSGNKDIIEHGREGLSRLAEINENKIRSSEIFIIKSKADYQQFATLMNSNLDEIRKSSSTLFD